MAQGFRVGMLLAQPRFIRGLFVNESISFFVAKVTRRDFVTRYDTKGPRRFSSRDEPNKKPPPTGFMLLCATMRAKESILSI